MFSKTEFRFFRPFNPLYWDPMQPESLAGAQSSLVLGAVEVQDSCCPEKLMDSCPSSKELPCSEKLFKA